MEPYRRERRLLETGIMSASRSQEGASFPLAHEKASAQRRIARSSYLLKIRSNRLLLFHASLLGDASSEPAGAGSSLAASKRTSRLSAP